jgi:hypothetical protein
MHNPCSRPSTMPAYPVAADSELCNCENCYNTQAVQRLVSNNLLWESKSINFKSFGAW